MAWEETTLKGATFPLPSGGTVEITDDTYVSMGAGFTFRRLTYTNDTCEIVFEVHDGVPGAVSIKLWSDKTHIRAKDLTAIKLDQIRNEVYAVAGVGAFTPDAGDDYELTGADAREAVTRATTRHKITPEFLARVAELHNATPVGGRLEAVKAAFQVHERTALRYIAAARREGLIGDE